MPGVYWRDIDGINLRYAWLMTDAPGLKILKRSNIVDAFITFLAVRISDRPADKSHPYGHGNVENLSALIETGLLLLTCLWIISEAVDCLFFTNTDIDPSIRAFLVIVLSIVIYPDPGSTRRCRGNRKPAQARMPPSWGGW